MSENHTRGPWRVKDNGSMEGPHVYGAVHPVDGGDYAPLAGYHGGALSQADARLIAAAPELLASLKSLFGYIEKGELVRDITRDAAADWAPRMAEFVMYLGKATAAIAKAEGRP